MYWKPRGWTLVGMLLLAMPWVMAVVTAVAVAQVSQLATTTVTDTIYRADGTTATGTVIVSWPAFSTASGQAVPSGSTSATIGAGGVMTVQLVPNAGSTPMGSYYTAVYHLDDGTVSREYWVVPVSQTSVQVSAIRSTVLPTSVAMQTVSKSYVDTAIAAAVSGHPLDSSTPYVQKAGDTMTGPLVLPADPTTPTQAADKHYVDANVSAVTAGIGQKVSMLPSGTQAVAQPTGTQLQVNILNGTEYASQYVSGTGNNGIANALASPDCASGCEVKAEETYNSLESYSTPAFNSSNSGGTHVEDSRNGERRDSFMNPTNLLQSGMDAGQVIDVASTRTAASVHQRTNAQGPASVGLLITHEGLAGGSNLFPQNIETTEPYFKSTYSALAITGTYNTVGQHVMVPQAVNCFGVGDCLMGSQFLLASGGFRDNADEGSHPFDLQISEDARVFQGTCSSGCTTGSTVVTVAATSAPGTQGEGRYLIDKNPAKVISTGVLTGAATGAPGAIANFSGTAFPLSIFLTTAQVAPSQASDMAPGTVTLAIATTGVTAGFATNTAALPNQSGVACVVDVPNGFAAHNYEMANYTVVDGTHIQLTLNKVHASGATIAVGGLCGYGLEQTVDTAQGIRQVFPVIGSFSATGLYYAGGLTAIVGVSGQSSAYLNLNLQVAAIARNSNVVTVTTAGNLPVDVNGLTMTVAGVADQSYNGSYVVATTGPNTLTYAETGANSTSTGGTVSMLTGGFALYPMAEVLGVFDQTTKSIDGQMTLAANTVPWAPNDAVEQPHYYQEAVSADTEFVTQITPRATTTSIAGIQYQGNVGPGVNGWVISNAVPASNYLGNGGTHTVPAAAFSTSGIWKKTLDAQAGDQSVFSIHCNSHGCGRWNSLYNLFELDSSVGTDVISFQPTTSTLTMTLRGTSYGFSPQGLTAGTVNATTLNGAINGANITSGTVSAARLPVFGPSGSTHAVGAVPDPGAVAGTARYLREDGTWATPSGTGGTSSPATSFTGPGSTLYVYGDSHPSGQGLLAPVSQAFPALIAGARGWTNNNMAITGYTYPDITLEYNLLAQNSVTNVNMLEMGGNDATLISEQQGGAQTAINATNAALLQGYINAYADLLGTLSGNKIWATSMTQSSGTWSAGYTGDGWPAGASLENATAGSSLTFSFTGTRVDVLIGAGISSTPSTFTIAVDGVLQTLAYPNGTTTGSNATTYVGASNVDAIIGNVVRGLAPGTHTCVITVLSGANNGVTVLGAIFSDSTSTAPRPLVMTSYAARYGTASVPYSNHTDAYMATVWAAQAVTFNQLMADGFNITTTNYSQAPTSVPAGFTIANSWWNPNDPTQTQSDSEHPNYIGAQHIANAYLISLINAGK